uniref:Sulfatase N-terminal domain-containing protein n=1 Tax=Ditylenchus dipsaci TaxID=166011 RepID=A0A915E0L4_9BILA
MIVLDSVSRSRFLRSLPKSLYFLQEDLEAITYHHLNKVGLNSMPNAFAFLFGRQMEPLPKSPLHEQKVLPDPGFDYKTRCSENLDNETSWIFAIFKKLGYKTMIAEDWAKGAVNWPDCVGFKNQPTDHYMRPFQIRVEMDQNTFETSHCREHYLFLLEYLQQFLEVYQDEQQKFTMTWIVELTHNYLNSLYHADDTFYKWFKDTHEKVKGAGGARMIILLKWKTHLFLMSDHGVRFGDHRSTPVGEIEDNNPGLFIVLPRRLRKNKKLREIMQENAQQLVSQHDVTQLF